MSGNGVAIGSLALTIALLFLAGYITQRTSVCAVAAAQEIVRARRLNRLLGFLFSAAVATSVMAIDELSGNRVFINFPGHAATLITAAGAIVFAAGAMINGRCAMGTLADLAAGDLARLGTLSGLLIGLFGGMAMFKAWLGTSMISGPVPSPYVGLDPLATLGLAALAGCGLWLLLRRGLRQAPAAQFWSPALSMALTGLASGLLFALDRNWPYTALLADLARGMTGDIAERLALTMVVLAGSVIAAWRGRLFSLRHGSAVRWLRAGAGGLLMGAGASLVPGGNEAMLYTGLPLLLPNLSVAYAITMASLILFAWMTNRALAED